MEVQDTPLRTAIMRIMSEMLDSPDEHGIYETGRFMDRIEQLLCDMMAAPDTMQLSGSEAVFGFMAWLTTRNETTCLGPHQQVDVDIIKRFVEANNLKDPRESWAELLTHPEELSPEPVFSNDDTSLDDPIEAFNEIFSLDSGPSPVRFLDRVTYDDPDFGVGEEEITPLSDNKVSVSAARFSPDSFLIEGSLEEVLAFIVKTGIHKLRK